MNREFHVNKQLAIHKTRRFFKTAIHSPAFWIILTGTTLFALDPNILGNGQQKPIKDSTEITGNPIVDGFIKEVPKLVGIDSTATDSIAIDSVSKDSFHISQQPSPAPRFKLQ